MSVEYDKYYQTKNLFGSPYPELLEFYSSIESKGKLLDIGCGQGRDAIPLAQLGYKVTGLDYSKVGIEQLNQIAKQENLPLEGMVQDIYAYNQFGEFDFILLDSMFHFGKKDRAKEEELLKTIFTQAKSGALITICIQNTGKKVAILHSIIEAQKSLKIIHQKDLIYIFEDKESNHRSETQYEMITVRK